jgi:hypothetical protein
MKLKRDLEYIKLKDVLSTCTSRFRGMFLVPLERSGIASPEGTGSLKKNVDFVLNFRFFGATLRATAAPRAEMSS